MIDITRTQTKQKLSLHHRNSTQKTPKNNGVTLKNTLIRLTEKFRIPAQLNSGI